MLLETLGIDALAPVVALEFFEALGLVALIINFIMLYNFFSNGIIRYPVINVIVTSIVTFTLLVPFPWFNWIIFFFLFAYAFFWSFKPWEWSK